MPNPSTIAMNEETLTEEHVKEAFEKSKDDDRVLSITNSGVERTVVIGGNATLEQKLADLNADFDQYVQDANETIIEKNGQIDRLDVKVYNLTESLSIMGAELQQARERNYDLLRTCCDTFENNRKLKDIVRAAVRYLNAREDFELAEDLAFYHNAPGPTDKQTQEVAEAHAQLDQLIEENAALLG